LSHAGRHGHLLAPHQKIYANGDRPDQIDHADTPAMSRGSFLSVVSIVTCGTCIMMHVADGDQEA
jgi:hypothetical protein